VSRLVLIADTHPDRADRIREACALRGHATRVVTNGADALEAAVREGPEVCVFAPSLDLIDAVKLFEILRSNPRTRRCRFVFLGAPVGAVDEWSAVQLPVETDPDEVGECVAGLVARSSELDSVVRDEPEEVEGRLAQIPLGDLLQLFHLNRRTGTIELRRRTTEGRPERGRIHLRDGDVVQAIVGPVTGEKALFRLLTWGDGSFAFRPQAQVVEARIQSATRALLMEGMRQLDEWNRVAAELPDRHAQVAIRVGSADLPNVVHPLTQEVMLLLELYGSVGEVVDHCSFPDYQVLRTLQTLAERGIVEIKSGAPPQPDAGIFEASQLRRLRKWLLAGRPAGSAPPEAKLLLASPTPELTREFLRLLAELPGVQLTPGWPDAAAADRLAPAARLRLDDDLAIEIVHVPIEPVFGPLWPVVGFGALGALVLMDGSSVGEAEAALRPLCQGLGGVPRARLLRLVLLRPGTAAPAKGLREHVGLLEDAVVLLPLDREKEPAERLQGALARLVP
jgi:CheY-like chemotaxis protein